MLYFKACPRCNSGTVEHASDSWGQYLQCLMCGFQRDFDSGVDPVAELATAQRQVRDAIAARADNAEAVA